MPRRPQNPNARLAVLLARDAPVGVVFRRTRTKLVQIVLWNRETDQFEAGHWFKGRIFADRSDISPDGQHLIYFAMGGVAWAIAATGGTWTAISLVPSLTASALWGQGGTRGGGGLFTSNDSFWLDSDASTFRIRDESGLRRESYEPGYSRMERNGWIKKGTAYDPIYERAIGCGWTLRRTGRESGHELERPGELRLKFIQWEWADWDRHRLVWAEAGSLRTATLSQRGPGDSTILYDFNLPMPGAPGPDRQ
jgi:hypothetical protein